MAACKSSAIAGFNPAVKRTRILRGAYLSGAARRFIDADLRPSFFRGRPNFPRRERMHLPTTLEWVPTEEGQFH